MMGHTHVNFIRTCCVLCLRYVCTHIDTPVSCVEGMHEPELPTVFAVVTSVRFGCLLSA